MTFFNNEKGLSLIETVAAIIIISIILISFFNLFLQSKKTNVASESIVDATYVAQQDMENLYGLISTNNASWFATNVPTITLQGSTFNHDTSDPTCVSNCKKFRSTTDAEHWVKLEWRNSNLVNVIVNVPKENSSTPVVMESIFRWGN